jgi:hypothetical protein
MWRIAIAFLLGVGFTLFVLRHSRSLSNTSQSDTPFAAQEPKLQAAQPSTPTASAGQPVTSASPAQAAVVLQPIKIKIAYGETMIPPGTTLPIVWQNVTSVGVNYLGQAQTIPLSSVRLVSVAPASTPPTVAAAPKQENKLEQSTTSRPAGTFNVSSLSLDAHERATADGTQTRWTTVYGSYHRDYRRRKKIVVIVHDLSRHAPSVTVHVYFIARRLQDDTRFIYDAKELPIEFDGQLEATTEIEMPILGASETYYSSINARYVGGADIDGWIVAGEVGGKMFGTKASGPALLDIAQQQDFLAKMVAESGIHPHPK